MIVLPNQKAAFAHIPKTGGDSVSKFLLENVQGAYRSGGGKHWPIWMHPAVPNGFRTFAFVREPVSWYKSFYAFILNNYIKEGGKYPVFEQGMFHVCRRFEGLDWSSFSSFIKSLYAADPAYYTRMIEWMIGTDHQGTCAYVGRQENLPQSLADILVNLGLPNVAEKAVTGLPVINTSAGADIQVPKTIITLIQKQEHAVYRRFNYEK